MSLGNSLLNNMYKIRTIILCTYIDKAVKITLLYVKKQHILRYDTDHRRVK